MNHKIIHGDCLEVLRNGSSDAIDCIVTDPPYGYSFMGKDWDKAVPSVEIWRECLRVLKPGAFAFVMSAPRQDVLSQMIVRLTEAGFDTNFTSIYWTYGQGFPKSGNLDKMLKKRGVSGLCACESRSTSENESDSGPNATSEAQGFQSDCLSSPRSCGEQPPSGGGSDQGASPSQDDAQERTRSLSHGDGLGSGHASTPSTGNDLPSSQGYLHHDPSSTDTRSYTDENTAGSGDAPTPTDSDGLPSGTQRRVSGLSFPNCSMCGKPKANGAYLGFQPKPAVEIIIVAMKPLSEKTYVDQAMKNGKGVTWLDDCRVPTNPEVDDPRLGGKGDWSTAKAAENVYEGGYAGERVKSHAAGRFPANLICSDDILNDGRERKVDQQDTSLYDGEVCILGNIATSTTDAPIAFGVSQEAERPTASSNIAGSGSKPTEKSQKGWLSITRMATKKTILSLTSNSSQTLNIVISTDESAKLIKWLETSNIEGVSVADATSLWLTSPSGERVLITGTVSPVSPSISENGGSEKSYSRFFSLDQWAQNLPEHVRKVFPFLIVPKASKREKNEGLEGFEEKQTLGGGGLTADVREDGSLETASAGGKFGSVKALQRNTHATVKPLQLMSYLITLGSRTGDTVLDPFVGSGTTVCAAKSLGRNGIGIEREEEYVKIAEARLKAVKER